MNHWLVKTEPGDYSFDDLLAEGRTVWDGVKNNQALLFIRDMQKNDPVFVYHTGKEKRIVGLAEVVSQPYPDPAQGNEKLTVVDIKAKRAVPAPVTLATIKADKRFADFYLVRLSRLSVMPVPATHWRRLEKMCGLR